MSRSFFSRGSCRGIAKVHALVWKNKNKKCNKHSNWWQLQRPVCHREAFYLKNPNTIQKNTLSHRRPRTLSIFLFYFILCSTKMPVKGSSDEWFLSSSIHINTGGCRPPCRISHCSKERNVFHNPASGCDFAAEHMGATLTSPPVSLGSPPFLVKWCKASPSICFTLKKPSARGCCCVSSEVWCSYI